MQIIIEDITIIMKEHDSNSLSKIAIACLTMDKKQDKLCYKTKIFLIKF